MEVVPREQARLMSSTASIRYFNQARFLAQRSRIFQHGWLDEGSVRRVQIAGHGGPSKTTHHSVNLQDTARIHVGALVSPTCRVNDCLHGCTFFDRNDILANAESCIAVKTLLRTSTHLGST